MTTAIRLATPTDEAFLAELFRDVHRHEFAPLGLPEAQLESLLAMQFRAQQTGYARDYPLAVDRILVEEQTGSPIGRILVEKGAKAIHLVDIALLSPARGKGLGSALIEDLIGDSRNSGLPIRLMVQPGNPAFGLYTRLGFRLIGGGMSLTMEFSPAAEDNHTASEAVEAGPRAGSEWDARLGCGFRVVDAPEGAHVVLRLDSLQRPRWEGRAFTLVFHGPLAPILPQAIYNFAPAEADRDGDTCSIFIVPIGPAQDEMQYEAIFN